MYNWCYINQDFVKDEHAVLPVNDLAFLRGYGVFDFFKVAGKVPLFLKEHLDRFYFSSEQMHLNVPLSRQEIINIVKELISKNQIEQGGIRLSLTGGCSSDGITPGTPNIVITAHDYELPTEEKFEKGIRLFSYEHQRQLPWIKSIDYLMSVWLQPLLKKHNADDLLYHQEGIVTECPRSNFFIVTIDNRLVTPSSHILKGITRNRILKIAGQLMTVEEKDISLGDIYEAEEAFICSTTKLILPVVQLNKHSFKAPGKVTRKLYEYLSAHELIEGESAN